MVVVLPVRLVSNPVVGGAFRRVTRPTLSFLGSPARVRPSSDPLLLPSVCLAGGCNGACEVCVEKSHSVDTRGESGGSLVLSRLRPRRPSRGVPPEREGPSRSVRGRPGPLEQDTDRGRTSFSFCPADNGFEGQDRAPDSVWNRPASDPDRRHRLPHRTSSQLSTFNWNSLCRRTEGLTRGHWAR